MTGANAPTDDGPETEQDGAGAKPGAGTTRTATVLTALAAGTGVALLASTVGDPRVAALTAGGGVLFGAGALLHARDGPLAASVASALVPVAALLVAGGAALSVVAAGVAGILGPESATGVGPILRTLVLQTGVATAAGLVAFGTVATLGDGTGDGAVGSLWSSTVVTLPVVGAALAAVAILRFETLTAVELPRLPVDLLLAAVLAPSNPVVGAVSLCGLVCVACLAVRVALGAAPVAELAPRRRREDVRAAVDRALSRLGYGVVISFLLGFGLGVSALVAPGIAGLVTALSPPPLRVLVLGVGLVAGAVALAGWLLQRLTGSTADAVRAALPHSVGGVLVVATSPVTGGVIQRRAAELPAGARGPAVELVGALSPAGAALALGFAALFATAVTLAGLATAEATGFVPSRGAGGALAAAGLVVGAVAVGGTGGPPVVVYLAVALAVVAWDVGEHGVGVRTELGSRAGTRLTVVHALGSVVLGAVGVGVAVALLGATGGAGVSGRALAGGLSVVAGALLVLGVLKG